MCCVERISVGDGLNILNKRSLNRHHGILSCLEQTNKDNQQICDGECEHTYIDGTTLEEMCASSNVSVCKQLALILRWPE